MREGMYSSQLHSQVAAGAQYPKCSAYSEDITVVAGTAIAPRRTTGATAQTEAYARGRWIWGEDAVRNQRQRYLLSA